MRLMCAHCQHGSIQFASNNVLICCRHMKTNPDAASRLPWLHAMHGVSDINLRRWQSGALAAFAKQGKPPASNSSLHCSTNPHTCMLYLWLSLMGMVMILLQVGSSSGLWNCATYGCLSASAALMRLLGLNCSSEEGTAHGVACGIYAHYASFRKHARWHLYSMQPAPCQAHPQYLPDPYNNATENTCRGWQSHVAAHNNCWQLPSPAATLTTGQARPCWHVGTSPEAAWPV